MEKQGFGPMSFEEGSKVQIKHDATFFSRREAQMKAYEEGKELEYVKEEDKGKDMRNTMGVKGTHQKLDKSRENGKNKGIK